MTTEHADSLSENGTNSPLMKNSGSEIKHAGGNLLKKSSSLTFRSWQHSKFAAKSSLIVMQF